MIGFALASLLAATPALETPDERVVMANVGFENSEAVRHDVAGDRYLVGNLGPRGAGNDGFISVVAPDGLRVTEVKWIEGGRDGVVLHDPLGLIIEGDRIHVADTNAIRSFDRVSGAPVRSVEAPGSVRLNDLAAASDGTLYVTDSGNDQNAGALYRISATGEVSVFAPRSEALQRPNGVAVLSDGTVVHGGLLGKTLFYRSPDGQLLRQRDLPTGRIDGIIAAPNGDLYVASQDGHVVYRVPADEAAPPVVVASDIEIPAAIGVDFQRRRLLTPQIRVGTLTIDTLP
jgi:sugar lactone lactonase YvrE